jgi:hypothetical protein
MTVDTSSLTIEGRILNPQAKKISFEKRDAQILSEDASFRLKDYQLTDATNDINYRVFDETGNQLEK